MARKGRRGLPRPCKSCGIRMIRLSRFKILCPRCLTTTYEKKRKIYGARKINNKTKSIKRLLTLIPRSYRKGLITSRVGKNR